MSQAPISDRVDALEAERTAGRVLIVESRAMVGLGLTALLADEGFEVIAEVRDADHALTLARQVAPDLLLVNLAGRPRGLGPVLATATAVRDMRLFVLTDVFRERTVFEALAAGATGCVAVDAPAEEIVYGIRAVLRGECFISPRIARRLARRLGLDGAPILSAGPSLSAREREVLALVARGWDNAQIGEALHLSRGTVKHHVANLFAKLEVSNRLQAAVRAIEDDLLQA
jgi:DNA-binding NarL/FixJ family response regulator